MRKTHVIAPEPIRVERAIDPRSFARLYAFDAVRHPCNGFAALLQTA
jgi:hypothetical protein